MRDYQLKGVYKAVCPFFDSCLNGKYCPSAYTQEVKESFLNAGVCVDVYRKPPSKCFINIKGK